MSYIIRIGTECVKRQYIPNNVFYRQNTITFTQMHICEFFISFNQENLHSYPLDHPSICRPKSLMFLQSFLKTSKTRSKLLNYITSNLSYCTHRQFVKGRLKAAPQMRFLDDSPSLLFIITVFGRTAQRRSSIISVSCITDGHCSISSLQTHQYFLILLHISISCPFPPYLFMQRIFLWGEKEDNYQKYENQSTFLVKSEILQQKDLIKSIILI